MSEDETIASQVKHLEEHMSLIETKLDLFMKNTNITLKAVHGALEALTGPIEAEVALKLAQDIEQGQAEVSSSVAGLLAAK